eukprot:396009_1
MEANAKDDIKRQCEAIRATKKSKPYSILLQKWTLKTFYCGPSVSTGCKQMIRKLPSFITDDTTIHCDFIVQPKSKVIVPHHSNSIKNELQ